MATDRDKIRWRDEELAEAWFVATKRRVVDDRQRFIWTDDEIIDAFAAGRESLRAELAAGSRRYGRLVKIAEHLARGECTCADGGPGFVCDVCEAKAVLAELAEKVTKRVMGEHNA